MKLLSLGSLLVVTAVVAFMSLALGVSNSMRLDRVPSVIVQEVPVYPSVEPLVSPEPEVVESASPSAVPARKFPVVSVAPRASAEVNQ